MVTRMSAGKIYVLDATVFNADGSSVNLSAGTQGIDWTEFDIPDSVNETMNAPGIRVKTYFGGKSYTMKDGISDENMTFRVSVVAGTMGSAATKRAFIRRYFNLHKENGADKSYMYIRQGTGPTDFETWYDADNSAQVYMKCEWIGGAFRWTMSGDENLLSEGTIKVKSAWE